MTRSIRIAAVVAATLSIGLIVGCGGSSSDAASSTSADSAMSKEQYVTQVNALCADASARGKALTPPTDAASIEGFLTEQANIGKNITDGIAALPAPADISASATTILDTYKAQLALITDANAKIAGGADAVAEIKALIEAGAPLTETANAAAKEAGLTECID